MARRRLITVATALLALSACGSSNPSNASGSHSPSPVGTSPPHITIDAKEYAFTLPAQIPAGWVDVTLHNSGKVGHQIAFAKLGPVSFAAFETAASATDVKALAGVQFVGGPNDVDPGSSVTAVVHFDPGAYGVACFIPDDKDGKPHAEHGMVGQVDVVRTAASVDDPPKVDGGSITLSEFTFLPDASFTGTGTVEIKNVGTQVHELIVVKEAPGKSLADVKAFFLAPPGTPSPGTALPAGPPPFTSAGGIVGLGPNQTAYQTMALTPGKYVLLCLFPDPTKRNMPHALEGMIKEITIS
ncbi:MAG TPA: hypothetical protein VIK54_06225 [Acidimicrobiia bacterium]